MLKHVKFVVVRLIIVDIEIKLKYIKCI